MSPEMRRNLFMIVFWLAVMLAIGSAIQYWLSSEEEQCLQYCAAEGKLGKYTPPTKGGMRFARRAARPGDCRCVGPGPPR